MSRVFAVAVLALGLVALAPAVASASAPTDGPLCVDRELAPLGPALEATEPATPAPQASIAPQQEDLAAGRAWACGLDGASDDPSCHGEGSGAPTRHDPSPIKSRPDSAIVDSLDLHVPAATLAPFPARAADDLPPGHQRRLERPPRA